MLSKCALPAAAPGGRGFSSGKCASVRMRSPCGWVGGCCWLTCHKKKLKMKIMTALTESREREGARAGQLEWI